jgi:hypothetical protein
MRRLRRRATELFHLALTTFFVVLGLGLVIHHYVTFN